MITSNSESESLNIKEGQTSLLVKINAQTLINQHNEKLEHEQCIKWIYDGEKNYIRGYN